MPPSPSYRARSPSPSYWAGSCRRPLPGPDQVQECRFQIVRTGGRADLVRRVVRDQVAVADEQQPVAAGLPRPSRDSTRGSSYRQPPWRGTAATGRRAAPDPARPSARRAPAPSACRPRHRPATRGPVGLPDNVPTSCPAASASPTPATARSASARLMSGYSEAKYRAFSRIVRSGYTLGAWVRYPTWLRNCAEPAGCPSTVTVPDFTCCTPTMARISVVFPLPLGPSSPVTLPLGMMHVSPRSTRLRPRWMTRSRTSIAVSICLPPGRTQQPLNSTLDEISGPGNTASVNVSDRGQPASSSPAHTA